MLITAKRRGPKKDGKTFPLKSWLVLVVVSIITMSFLWINSNPPDQNPGADIISILDTDVLGTTALPELKVPRTRNTSALPSTSISSAMTIEDLSRLLEKVASEHLAIMARSSTLIDGYPPEYGIQKPDANSGKDK